MSSLGRVLIGFIALEHLFIMYMEMFAWNTMGKKIFKKEPFQTSYLIKQQLWLPIKVCITDF